MYFSTFLILFIARVGFVIVLQMMANSSFRNMGKVNKYIMALVGAASGLLSFIAIEMNGGFDSLGSTLSYSPGPIFGISLSIYLLVTNRDKFHLGRHFLWWLSSSIAYYAAVNTAVNLINAAFWGQEPSYFTIFAAGTVGAFIVGISFSYLISKIYFSRIILLGIIGGGLGFSFFIPIGLPLLPLYIVWQTGIAFSLGLVIEENRRK